MKTFIKKIFHRDDNQPVSIPSDIRAYCIGDIHGRDDLLRDIHEQIAIDAAAYLGEKIVIYLGDYIDRGLHSKDVVDHLIKKPLEGFQAIYLRGNHEQVLLDFLNVDHLIASEWFNFGGQSTVLSYGVSIAGIPFGEKLKQLQLDLADKIPAEHMSFYAQLKYSYELGDYLFVHAGLKPKVALHRQNEMDMLWIRNEFLNSKYRYEKMIVHGHSVVEEPEEKANRIAIDTGAYVSGRLTCLVLEGEQRRYLQTSGNAYRS